MAERANHRGIRDGAIPAAVANAKELAVPLRGRHPDFNPDVRIRSGLQRRGNAAHRGEGLHVLTGGPGSARAPGPTGCTSVTSPPFRRSEARRSHAAASGTGTCGIAAATTAHNPTPTDTAPILRPSDLLALRILPACSRTNVHVTRRIRFRQCNGGSRTGRASRPRLPHGRIRIGRRARRRVEGIESLSDAFGEPLEELEHGHSCITTAPPEPAGPAFGSWLSVLGALCPHSPSGGQLCCSLRVVLTHSRLSRQA